MMKKLLFAAAILFAASNAAMAQKNVENLDATKSVIDYSFKVNYNAINRSLKLNVDQADKMEYICERFDRDLQTLGNGKAEKRSQRFYNALSYNLSAAHKVLSEEQYRKYLAMLNSTIRHKGLDIYLPGSDMASAE